MRCRELRVPRYAKCATSYATVSAPKYVAIKRVGDVDLEGKSMRLKEFRTLDDRKILVPIPRVSNAAHSLREISKNVSSLRHQASRIRIKECRAIKIVIAAVRAKRSVRVLGAATIGTERIEV